MVNQKCLFEKIIEKYRYIIYLPVITLLLSSLFIFIWTLRNYNFLGYITTASEKEVITKIITTIDLFLIGVILMIVALSLYEMYISPIKDNSNIPKPLIIEDLEELKSKLSKLVYLVLVITFFKYAINMTFNTPLELLYLAGSILFISLSIYFTHLKVKENGKEEKKSEKQHS